MATSYTTLLGLALPVQGELIGTWGDTVNAGITSLLDTAVAGTTTLSTDADVTLTTTTGSSNQARQAILNCTGARTALRTITAPAASKAYVIINGTTGGFGVKIVGVGPTTGVTILAGQKAIVAWNGSDFVVVAVDHAVPGPIGSTTPSTGAFTTLSLTSDITQSSATARTTYSSTTGNGGLQNDNASAYALLYGSTHATQPAWFQSNATRYNFYSGGNLTVLDGSGNLGLGSAPSAWGANWKAIDSGTGSAFAGFVGGYQTWMFANAYADSASTYKYKATSTAGAYSISGNIHVWSIAASGTAGTAVSFTTAMTLDASGYLNLGAASARFTGGSSTGGAVFGGTEVSSYMQTYGSGHATKPYGIDFVTAATYRASFDSSGNFLVGTTSTSSALPNGFVIANPTGTTQFYVGHTSGSGSGTYYGTFSYNSTLIGSITQSGTTAVLYNTTSDQRLKENIVDADDAASLIDSIQVRQYDWKSDGAHQRYGFVAQELVTVYPEAVHQPEDPEAMMAVDYSKLVPLLTKEVQSLRAYKAQAETAITDLINRVAALEAK